MVRLPPPFGNERSRRGQMHRQTPALQGRHVPMLIDDFNGRLRTEITAPFAHNVVRGDGHVHKGYYFVFINISYAQ